MRTRMRVSLCPFAVLIFILTAATRLLAQGVNVTAEIAMNAAGPKTVATTETSQAVVWLTPMIPYMAVAPGHYRLVQKDKMFRPHLLVIPTGSTVAFPNFDPFFHNVFSLFNGKRFDLGLYEAGATRDVHFNHEGVSFIFCNIHPEMSAVILTLATPYYGVSGAGGKVELHDVPLGTYRLNVWAEGVEARQLETLGRMVDVSPAHENLGIIRIIKDAKPAPHKNKFGDDYKPSNSTIY